MTMQLTCFGLAFRVATTEAKAMQYSNYVHLSDVFHLRKVVSFRMQCSIQISCYKLPNSEQLEHAIKLEFHFLYITIAVPYIYIY